MGRPLRIAVITIGLLIPWAGTAPVRDALTGSDPLFDASAFLNSARQGAGQTSSVTGSAPQREQLEHGVITIDAGSSGTRVYEVRYGVEGRDCRYRSSMRLFETDKALARLPAAALPGLLDHLSNRYPQVRRLAVKAVGTGGFRNLDAGDGQACAAACSRKKKEIQDALAASYPNARFHVASGEEEAELGWISVAALTGRDSHAIVDIGGSTVELAFKKAGRLQGLMANTGANTVAAGVPECAPPLENFSACMEAVERFILRDEGAKRLYLSSVEGTVEVVGLGGAFRRLKKLVQPGAASFNPHENIGRIESLARSLCRAGGPEADVCPHLALELLLIKKFRVNQTLDASVELGAAFSGIEELQSPQALACRNGWSL